MKNISMKLALVIALQATTSHAAYTDLSKGRFPSKNPTNMSYATDDLMKLYGNTYFIINVSDITGFEWRYSTQQPQGDSYSYFLFPDMGFLRNLANPSSLNGSGTTGWRPYAFDQPMSGRLVFNMYSVMDTQTTTLEVRNMSVFSAVSAIPEPESWSMLLAGIGLAGCLARGRSRSRIAQGLARS